MKLRKYILILLLVVFIGWNRVEAAEDKCYYMGNEFKAVLDIKNVKPSVNVDLIGKRLDNDSEAIINWYTPGFLEGRWCNGDCPLTTVGGHKFDDLYKNNRDAKKNGACPNYLVIEYCKKYHVWGTNDSSEAVQASSGIDSNSGCVGRYATFKHSDGVTRITADEYYSSFINPNSGGEEIPMNDPDKACKEIFGDVNYAGETDVDTNGNGYIDPPSLAYLINSVLKYIRIIVPILIILLGSLDFAKAVTAGKEDEMKKAQSTFVKRIIAGILVFFVPVLVNLIMSLADMVWDGMGLSHCNLP